MACGSLQLQRTLIRFGNKSSANLAELEAWSEAAVREIAENKGGHTVSGTVNGISFAQQASMTNAEWAATLDVVLQHIENETMPSSRTQARLV